MIKLLCKDNYYLLKQKLKNKLMSIKIPINYQVEISNNKIKAISKEQKLQNIKSWDIIVLLLKDTTWV